MVYRRTRASLEALPIRGVVRVRMLSVAEKQLYREAAGRDAPRCVVQRWPWWWRDFRGVALGALILVKNDRDPVLVCHEAAHVAQFYADPFRFWVRYLGELARVGYACNRYETDAREVEAAARLALQIPARRRT